MESVWICHILELYQIIYQLWYIQTWTAGLHHEQRLRKWETPKSLMLMNTRKILGFWNAPVKYDPFKCIPKPSSIKSQFRAAEIAPGSWSHIQHEVMSTSYGFEPVMTLRPWHHRTSTCLLTCPHVSSSQTITYTILVNVYCHQKGFHY